MRSIKTLLVLLSVQTVLGLMGFDISEKVDQFLKLINHEIRKHGRSTMKIPPGRLIAVHGKGLAEKMEYGPGLAIGLDTWQRIDQATAVYSDDGRNITINAKVGIRLLGIIFPQFSLRGHQMFAYLRPYDNFFNVTITIGETPQCVWVRFLRFHADRVVLSSSVPEFDMIDVSRFFKGDIQRFIVDVQDAGFKINRRLERLCHFVRFLPFDISVILEIILIYFTHNLDEGFSLLT